MQHLFLSWSFMIWLIKSSINTRNLWKKGLLIKAKAICPMVGWKAHFKILFTQNSLCSPWYMLNICPNTNTYLWSQLSWTLYLLFWTEYSLWAFWKWSNVLIFHSTGADRSRCELCARSYQNIVPKRNRKWRFCFSTMIGKFLLDK